MKIRKYTEGDNLGWIRCRVLSFLDSAYYDNVLREKEKYANPSIELVAEVDNKIVGLLDIEYESEIGTIGYKTNVLTAVIWHLAVLPEYRNLGIASSLLKEAIKLLNNTGIKIIQAWTRDDEWVLNWYLNRGFKLQEDKSYLHVYTEGKECNEITASKIKGLHLCSSFCHYVGEDKELIKKKFKRVHTCNLLELKI